MQSAKKNSPPSHFRYLALLLRVGTLLSAIEMYTGNNRLCQMMVCNSLYGLAGFAFPVGAKSCAVSPGAYTGK